MNTLSLLSIMEYMCDISNFGDVYMKLELLAGIRSTLP